jgi:formylmethanofuran--tetrahydromethanopterin N-formyltransferase
MGNSRRRISGVIGRMTQSAANTTGGVVDTYAEAFRSLYAEVLITARDRKWLDHAIHASCGHASSTIMCDCEAGLAQYVGPGSRSKIPTPDDRPGALVQFHVPRFLPDRVESLEAALLARICQNILTCPTAACFGCEQPEDYFKLGKKIAFFGDGHQYRDTRFGQQVWVIPILGGEFTVGRRFGYSDGIMGGNLWFMGRTVDAALEAAEVASRAVEDVPGTITTFPGGVAASGSKAGSRYSFMVASTYAEYCPTLRESLGSQSLVPDGVESIMEIIVNGCDLQSVTNASRAAIHASIDTPGLVQITAGNYGGRLGKSFIHLRDLVPAGTPLLPAS